MKETFTEHQARTALGSMGFHEAQVDEAVQKMRQTPRNAGALGFTDDELKGTARDEPSGVQGVRKQVG